MKKEQSPAQVRSRRGPPRIWDEAMQARFKAGTISRIDEVLKESETRVDFVNVAVLREIERREKLALKGKK